MTFPILAACSVSCTRRTYTENSWVTARPDIRHRLALKGIEPSRRPGRHRRVLKRTVSWLAGFRPPAPPPRPRGKAAGHVLSYDGIPTALLSHRRLTD